MRLSLLSIFVACSLATSANAQDALQQKGVTYWGQPAAQQLYQRQPTYPARQPSTQAHYRQSRNAAQMTQNSDHIDFEIVSGGVRRSAIVHIPRNYNPRVPLPVILVFHGLAMHAFEMPVFTGMNACGDRNGFLIVYPDALGGQWDDGFTGGNHGDVAFVEDLIKALPRLVAIDTHRVYACGISNGGFFSQRLACDLGNKIAGIAVVAAASYRSVNSRCNCSTIPVMFFNGTEDPLIPFDASKTINNSAVAEKTGMANLTGISGALAQLSGLMSVPDAVSFWVRHNGDGSPRTQYMPHVGRDSCKVLLEDYGSGRGEVAAYTIQNGGHTWPGGMPLPQALGTTAMDINASELICEFFRSR